MNRYKFTTFVLGLILGIIFLTTGVFADIGFTNIQSVQTQFHFQPDEHGGKYIVEQGKFVGYKYIQGDNEGWEVKFKFKVDWNQKTNLDKSKPFEPEGKLWFNRKLLYCKLDWKYTAPVTTETTTEVTAETTEPTPTPTISTETTETTEPTETIDTEVPTTEPVETVAPDIGNELPKTGEGTNLLLDILTRFFAMLTAVIVYDKWLKPLFEKLENKNKKTT